MINTIPLAWAILIWMFVGVLVLLMVAIVIILGVLTWAIVDGMRANNKEGK